LKVSSSSKPSFTAASGQCEVQGFKPPLCSIGILSHMSVFTGPGLMALTVHLSANSLAKFWSSLPKQLWSRHRSTVLRTLSLERGKKG
jgi:hypothetical protein